jgi:hypothetical protein
MNIKLTIWTATTDGDNCPLTTTVHATSAEACDRVRADLAPSDPLNQTIFMPPKGSIGEAEGLAATWERLFDGSCIIQSHEVDFAEAAADDEYDPQSPTFLAIQRMVGHSLREWWVDIIYRTRAGSLGHFSTGVTAATEQVAREAAEFEYRKKHRGEITDVRITGAPAKGGAS